MPLIQAVGFNIGLEITAADPDLQVLAKTVSPYPVLFRLLLTDGAGASPQSAFYKREQYVYLLSFKGGQRNRENIARCPKGRPSSNQYCRKSRTAD